jgi:hypothetical protein
MKQRILFLAANPPDTGQIALDRECAAIQDELRRAAGRDDFEFCSRWAVSIDDLMRHLNELSPTIVHFSGHGTSATARTSASSQRDVESPRPAGIVLQDHDRSQHVSERALASMIASASPSTRLVVLNACYSAEIADSLRQVVECVIGIDGAIEDTVARSFAVAFYRALGYHKPVGNAVDQAAATLAAKQQPDHLPICRTRNGVSAYELLLSAPALPHTPAPARPRGTVTDGSPTITNSPAQSTSPPIEAVGDHYDLFLAHPSANQATAGALFDLLPSDVRLFLTSRSLQPSDEWDQEILTAQRASRAIVLLISRHADAAWYLGAEVITALALHRTSPDAHRLVPVLLEPGIAVPLSIRHVAAIDATAVGGLVGVADRIRTLVAESRRLGPPVGRISEPARSGQTDGIRTRRDHFVLYERLVQLTDAAFEQIVSYARIEGVLAPRSAALTERALEVAQLAALDPRLSRRVSAELDRRAPWTRR